MKSSSQLTGRRPSPGLPLRVAGPQVLRRAGGLLRVARGRPDRGLAPDHGLDLNAQLFIRRAGGDAGRQDELGKLRSRLSRR